MKDGKNEIRWKDIKFMPTLDLRLLTDSAMENFQRAGVDIFKEDSGK
jgi:hypothetical protein